MKKTFLFAALIAATFTTYATEQAHWGYEGKTAPENWGQLSPEFSQCAIGLNQSPIDINNAVETASRIPLTVNYKASPQNVVNNGHTIQVNTDKSETLLLDGETFNLQQFHFHAPSENTINGKSFPLEAHFVHANKDGALTVLALMFNLGDENPELNKVWEQLPKTLNAPIEVKQPLDIAQLLPKKLDYYRFSGSLTTPPCSEGVRWLVLKDQVTLSEAQLKQFAEIIHGHNNRPVQSLNGRIIVD